MYVSDEEVYSLLSPQRRQNKIRSERECNDLDTAIIELSEGIRERASNSEYIPLYRLKGVFNLIDLEVKILILALAVEIDRKYERLYAYLNDDMTRKYPTVGLVLELFSDSLPDRARGQRCFSPDSPLVYFNLIEFVNDESTPTMNRGFRLRPFVKDFILGTPSLSQELLNSTMLYIPGHGGNSISPNRDALGIIKETLSGCEDCQQVLFWLFRGAESERISTVLRAMDDLCLPLFISDASILIHEENLPGVLKELFVMATLQSAPVLLTKAEVLGETSERSRLFESLLVRYIRELSHVTFISSPALAERSWFDRGVNLVPVELTRPAYNERLRVWKRWLSSFDIDDSSIEELSARYLLSESEIEGAIKMLGGGKGAAGAEQIRRTISRIITRETLSYASRIDSPLHWDDLILPADRKRQLREICDFVRHKHRVFYHWGFDRRVSSGRGLNILFSGPSGTGKTMAAGIMAKEIGADLYRIDLSLVVSKYIGETEKNLSRIFDFAMRGNIILFFDEADALFGKRTEIKDSHDRYANIEINYLLQKMEEHEGMVILATNLSKNMDQAFLRRMHFTVEFPFPEEQYRLEIWRRIYPGETPLSDDIDFAFLAERLQIAGGNIRNIALNSAAYAAAEGSPVSMKHVVRAAAREYQKMGRLCTRAEFGDYFSYVEEMLQGG